MCDRWSAYTVFLSDMGECPDGYTLERVNVDGNYEPSNCIWIPASEQARNRRSTRWISYGGDVRTSSEWARSLGMTAGGFYERIKKYGEQEAIARGARK